MARRGAYQRRLPKQMPVRSQQGKPAIPLGEDSFETRDLPSMKGGDWNKRPSDPNVKKKVAHKKKAPGGSPVGGNVSSNAAGAYPGA